MRCWTRHRLLVFLWRWQVVLILSSGNRIEAAVRGVLRLVVVGVVRLCSDVPRLG